MQIFYKLFLFFCIGFSSFCGAQVIIRQDVYNGGICFVGFSTGLTFGSGNFDTFVESGSTIDKVLLIYNIHGKPTSEINIVLDDSTINIPKETILPNFFYEIKDQPKFIGNINIIDITKKYTNINQHNISIPYQDFPDCNPRCFYSNFALIIIYKNPNLPKLGYSLFINNKDLNTQSITYSGKTNVIDNNFPVGFSVNSDIINTPLLNDGSHVYFENQYLGLIGGADNVNSLFDFGTRGHFYYQGNSLFGLDDDSADNTMSNSDALADVSMYIADNDSLNWSFIWQHPNVKQNIYTSFLFSYTTPCEPFDVIVTPDTTTCFNSPLQLHATGGSRYEWQPATGLSCADCPDPIVSTDSSRFYTVRIWNNDTCSVVRSVKVNVHPLPSFSSIQFTASECGESTGTLIAKSNQPVQYSIDGSVPKSSGIFNQLSAGFHTVSILDSNGCSKDTVIFIPEIISVNALFVANPPSGGAPLAVQFTNQSTNASNYEWFVDGVSQGSSFSNYLFDSTGVYTTTLVAWQNNPTCADTFTVHIHVYDSLMVQVPNVFTPNQDGNNDLFGITTNIPVFIDFQIFNRWGNVMASGQDLKSQVGIPFTPLWNGEDAIDGTYFYQITVRSQIVGQNLEVKADGFVHLVK